MGPATGWGALRPQACWAACSLPINTESPFQQWELCLDKILHVTGLAASASSAGLARGARHKASSLSRDVVHVQQCAAPGCPSSRCCCCRGPGFGPSQHHYLLLGQPGPAECCTCLAVSRKRVHISLLDSLHDRGHVPLDICFREHASCKMCDSVLVGTWVLDQPVA